MADLPMTSRSRLLTESRYGIGSAARLSTNRWMAKLEAKLWNPVTLEPGEELEFVGEWEQVDNRGEPVPPGVYLVRGGLNLGPPNAGPPGVVITTAEKVEVLK